MLCGNGSAGALRGRESLMNFYSVNNNVNNNMRDMDV
jgi:hypothetical protein